jgi:catechol 2,3-dioxygenase-like lactoylglutathione lyase family enzyme
VSDPSVSLVVLRCANLELSRAFYAALGLTLISEKHGSGPDHYSCTLGDLVLEFYPLGRSAGTSGLRIGFRVPSVSVAVAAIRDAKVGEVLSLGDAPPSAVVQDPDGHKLQLEE